jgi:hypothetical protein
MQVEGQVQRLNELEEIYRGLHMDDLIRKGKEQALTIRNILDRVETWKFTAEVERVRYYSLVYLKLFYS